MAEAKPERDFTKKVRRPFETVMETLLFLAAALSVVVTFAILWVLLSQSLQFFSFQDVSVVRFLTDTRWSPEFFSPDNPALGNYGIMPLLAGTLLVTLIALTVAIPLGLAIAIYLSEFAGPRAREVVKPTLELLAAVPTVIFGFFALNVVTPWLAALLLPFGIELPQLNTLSGGLVVGVLIIPYIASLAEDALRAVPNQLREGSLALGGTRLETAVRVVVPAAASGLAGAFILGMSRAIGETMVVAIAVGAKVNMTFDPTQSSSTITAWIAGQYKGEIEFGSVVYYSIYAAGLALLVLTLVFNLIAFWMSRKYREAY
jgi:phosphate transport system permease protein